MNLDEEFEKMGQDTMKKALAYLDIDFESIHNKTLPLNKVKQLFLFRNIVLNITSASIVMSTEDMIKVIEAIKIVAEETGNNSKEAVDKHFSKHKNN